MLPPKLWLNLWPQVGETVTTTTAREQRELTIQLHGGLNWIYCSHLTTVCPQGNSWWKKQGEGFYILDKWVPIQLIPKPFHSAGHLPDPGIKPGSPASWADSLPSKPSGKPLTVFFFLSFFQTVSKAGDRWTPGSIYNCPLDYISLGSKIMGFRPDTNLLFTCLESRD